MCSLFFATVFAVSGCAGGQVRLQQEFARLQDAAVVRSRHPGRRHQLRDARRDSGEHEETQVERRCVDTDVTSRDVVGA